MLNILASLLIATAARASHPRTAAAAPDCMGQMSLALDGEDGAFDGMSHSGALLVVRNLGPGACRMVGLPDVRFETAAGAHLPLSRRVPTGMRPGPVIVPVVIAAGAEATSPLRWVSSDAYDAHNCATPAKLVLGVNQTMHAIAWSGGQICGPAGATIPFDQPPLRADPTYPASR